MTKQTTASEPTRACDQCGKLIRTGYGTEDGGAWCSLECAGLTRVEHDQMEDEYANGGPEPFCYWTEWEDSDLPEAGEERASVAALLESRGWAREHTGGGCSAWTLYRGDYVHMLTRRDEATAPSPLEEGAVDLGTYDLGTGDCVQLRTAPSIAAALAWFDVYRAGAV